jgi:cell division protein FtsA
MGETIKLRTGGEMPAYRAGLVAVLDVGSSKTVCLIGRAEPGSLRVVGAALRESQGIRAGTVTSMEHAEESIRDAVAAAENHADVRIQNVIISVNCGQPTSVPSARPAAGRPLAQLAGGPRPDPERAHHLCGR